MRGKRFPFILLTLMSLFALGLAACGGGNSSSSGPVTIKYWYTEGDKEAPVIKDLIGQFQQQNPNIKVDAQLVPFDGAHDKFVTAAQNGTAPDAIRIDVGWNTEFANAGYLLDLGPYVKDTSDYLPAPLAYATWKGKLYGLPQVTDFLVLYYNKKMLTDAGISTPPTTFDDFDAANQKLTHGTQYGWSFQGGSYFAQPFIFGFGGGLIDASTTPPTVLINNAGSVNGFNELKKELKYAPKVDFSNGYTNTMTGFKAGQVAMIMNGPWEYGNILTGSAFSDPSNLGIAAVPYDAASGSATTPRSPAGGQNYAAYAGSKHPAEASKFIAFMSSASSQALIAAKNNTLPTRKSAYDDPQVKSAAAVNAFAALLPTQKARPVIPQGGQIYAPKSGFDPELQKFLTGAEDATTACNNIATGFKNLLGS